MGAAGSISFEEYKFSESLIEMYKICEDLKTEIAMKDARFIHEQTLHNWKDHTHLIDMLSERTKTQMFRIVRSFPEVEGSSLAAHDVTESELPGLLYAKLPVILGVSPYSQFLVDCFHKPSTLDAQYLENILTNIGCDEYLLVGILCTATQAELSEMTARFQSKTQLKLLSQLQKKLNRGSLQKFLTSILKCNRPTKNTGRDLSQVTGRLIECGLTCSKAEDVERQDESIFDILHSISRSECTGVDSAYRSRFNGQGLKEAIENKYKGSMAYALLLWSADSEASAIAKHIHHHMPNPSTFAANNGNSDISESTKKVNNNNAMRVVTHIIAKYDHWEMNLIIDAYNSQYCEDGGKGLVDRLGSIITGKYRRSVLAWLTCDKTCDGGLEHQIDEFMGPGGSGYSAKEMEDAHGTERDLLQLLTDQSNKLASYADSHHIHLPPSVVRRRAQDAVIDGTSCKEKKALKRGLTMGYEEKYQLVREFLREKFAHEDFDNSGYIDKNELWLILTDMQLGYTEEELTAFSSWIDIDDDGQIDYHEVLDELSADVIQVIEECDHISVEEKLLELRNVHNKQHRDLHASLLQSEETAAAIERRLQELETSQQQEEEDDSVSPSLMGFLADTFAEMDADNSGFLSPAELQNMLHTVLASSEGDKEILQIEWDANHDGKVSWEEASKIFSDLFSKYISTDMDRWIALVDKSNGHFFWFNLRDSNSFWMSEEDQRAYKEFIASGLEQEHALLRPSYVPPPRSEKGRGTGGSTKLIDNESGTTLSYKELRQIKKSHQK